jgi:gas vesicle protein
MSDNDSGSGVVLSFLLGGLAGAALALLYAPRSGRETRDQLAERFQDGASRGRELKERAISRGRQAVDDAGEYFERQRDNLSTRKERLATAIEAGRQAFQEEKEKL